jgi:hypothetical protein
MPWTSTRALRSYVHLRNSRDGATTPALLHLWADALMQVSACPGATHERRTLVNIREHYLAYAWNASRLDSKIEDEKARFLLELTRHEGRTHVPNLPFVLADHWRL